MSKHKHKEEEPVNPDLPEGEPGGPPLPPQEFNPDLPAGEEGGPSLELEDEEDDSIYEDDDDEEGDSGE